MRVLRPYANSASRSLVVKYWRCLYRCGKRSFDDAMNISAVASKARSDPVTSSTANPATYVISTLDQRGHRHRKVRCAVSLRRASRTFVWLNVTHHCGVSYTGTLLRSEVRAEGDDLFLLLSISCLGGPGFANPSGRLGRERYVELFQA